MYLLFSTRSLWYGEALRQACPLHLPQAKEHYNPNFLHPHREPQLFLELQNIVFNNSSGAGGNIVVLGSRNSFRCTQPHFWDSKSFPTKFEFDSIHVWCVDDPRPLLVEELHRFIKLCQLDNLSVAKMIDSIIRFLVEILETEIIFIKCKSM